MNNNKQKHRKTTKQKLQQLTTRLFSFSLSTFALCLQNSPYVLFCALLSQWYVCIRLYFVSLLHSLCLRFTHFRSISECYHYYGKNTANLWIPLPPGRHVDAEETAERAPAWKKVLLRRALHNEYLGNNFVIIAVFVVRLGITILLLLFANTWGFLIQIV